MNHHRYILIIVTILFVGCATQKTTTTVQGTKYSEDLSVLRPSQEIPAENTSANESSQHPKTEYKEAKYSVNKPLNEVLDSISTINLSRKVVDGFTIQIYSGLDREAALSTRKTLTTSLPEIESEVQYTQPNFRVKAGRYFSRMDAQKDFMAIRRYFPNAIVVPDRIAIN